VKGPPPGPVTSNAELGGASVTVMAAIPDFVVSSAEVAFTVADPMAAEGAVYVAVSFVVDAIVPRLPPQVTVGSKLPAPWTVAVHWLVWPSCTLVGLQETLTDVMLGGGATVIVAVPDLVESAVEVALTVSVPEVGMVAGAVYSPELEMVPEIADQVTAEL